MLILAEAGNVTAELVPYITAGGAALFGAIDGARVHRQLTGQRQNLVHELGEEDARGLVGETDVTPVHDRRYLTSPVVGSLALVYGVVGGLAGVAFQKDEAPRTVAPRIEYVATMSGTTGLAGDNKSTLSRVIKASDLLATKDKKGEVNAEAVVARAGKTPTVKIDEVGTKNGLGAAHMTQAVETAFDNIRNERAVATGGGKANAAVLVVTQGEGIGSVNRVIAEANSARVRTPVYIMDTGKNTGSGRRNNYEAIAEQTGGQYIKDVDKGIIDKIADNLQQAEIKTDSGGNSWDLKILAALFIAGAAAFRMKAIKYLPLRYHGSGE